MADLYYFTNSIISLVWIFKIQIVGSIFLSLTVFEYFYRRYRRKKIYEIKEALLNILDMGKEYYRDDAEHEFLAEKVKMLSDQITDNNEMLKERMSISNRMLLTKIDSEFEVVNLRLDTSNNKIESALVKIKVLEEDTDWIRALKKYKIIAFAALVGLIGANNFGKIAAWVKSLNIF